MSFGLKAFETICPTSASRDTYYSTTILFSQLVFDPKRIFEIFRVYETVSEVITTID